MITSPLIYFGSDSKPGHCEVSLANKAIGNNKRQCSSRSKTKRIFSDGHEHACCGQHARQFDTIANRAQSAGVRRELERELIARVAMLNIRSANLHYTISGEPTKQVLVDLEVLEQLMEHLHSQIDSLKKS